jgi:hypothetical protein
MLWHLMTLFHIRGLHTAEREEIMFWKGKSVRVYTGAHMAYFPKYYSGNQIEKKRKPLNVRYKESQSIGQISSFLV